MAKRKKKRIASRGSVNNIILKSLIEGDKYGYEIIKDVEKYSEGKIQLKQPSLYSSLSRFEDKGYVSSYWGDSDIGGRRHYYHLTDNGIAYYQRAVLKITDDSQEINEENVDENEIIDDIEEHEVENITEVIEEDAPILQEIQETEIPAIINFPDNTDEDDEELDENVIPDHHFYSTTPIEKSIFENIPVVKATPVVSSPWAELANSVKVNNRKIKSSPNKRLHYIIPKKQKVVVLDKDGIYKLRDSDYIPEHREAKPKIIDNVIKRTKDHNIYGYSAYTETQEKSINAEEITPEERQRRNDLFVAKFNSLTQSKYNDNEKTKDYQSKLNIFMDNQTDIEETMSVEQTPTPKLYQYDEKAEENNLFNYIDEPNEDTIQLSDSFEEDIEDKFIDFEPEEFETKNENKQYIQEISNYTAPTESVKVSRYVNNTNAILQDKSYVLINKVHCIFGFILALLLFLELTIALIIFKQNGLMFEGDGILFIVSFVVVTLLALCYILPILFNPNEHKLNNFKLKYAMLFGILTFLITAILVYCFNTLFGFQLDNIQYYAVKLAVPTILAFNFVLLPPIYGKLINCKKFYD